MGRAGPGVLPGRPSFLDGVVRDFLPQELASGQRALPATGRSEASNRGRIAVSVIAVVIGRSLIRVETETATMQEFQSFACSAGLWNISARRPGGPYQYLKLPKNGLKAPMRHSSQSG